MPCPIPANSYSSIKVLTIMPLPLGFFWLPPGLPQPQTTRLGLSASSSFPWSSFAKSLGPRAGYVGRGSDAGNSSGTSLPVSSALVIEDSTVVMGKGKGGHTYTSGRLSLLGTEVQMGGAVQTSTWTSGTERPSQHSLQEDQITAESLSNLCPSPCSLPGGVPLKSGTHLGHAGELPQELGRDKRG